jgi:hypothetical protein
MISDQLRTIDALVKDDALFKHLVDLRDALQADLIAHGCEFGRELGVLGPIIAGLDPVIIGQIVAGTALYGLTLRIEELHSVE